MGAFRRGGLNKCLLALAGLSPLLCALPARAEPFQTAGAGVFLGYSFGDSGGVEWGIEGFATRYLEEHADCGDHSERHGFGPMLRLGMVQLSRFEATLAAHGGGEPPGMRSYLAIDGELGGRLLVHQGRTEIVPHTGLTFESIIFNLYFRQAWLPPVLSGGGGARYIPTFGEPGFCEVGRAYRDHDGRRQSASLRREARFDDRNPRASLWARRAAEECSSVPAFLQLAVELEGLGAPQQLVVRAIQAASEELGHAHDAAELSALYGGAKVLAVPPAFRRRPRLPRRLALRRLATESWLDGCLNEGLSAVIASEEARDARLVEEALVLKRTAREEASHAALAFDVLHWIAGEAPDSLRGLDAPRPAVAPGHDVTTLGQAAARELAEQSARAARLRLIERS